MDEINYTSSKEVDIRREKIAALKHSGVIVYKEKFERTHTINEAREQALDSSVTIAGRIVFKRVMGKFSFIQIRDVESEIQVSVSVNEIG